jgi:hypothetical protein
MFQVSYYPSMDYGIDTNRTFEMKDLLIFTDNLEVKTGGREPVGFGGSGLMVGVGVEDGVSVRLWG